TLAPRRAAPFSFRDSGNEACTAFTAGLAQGAGKAAPLQRAGRTMDSEFGTVLESAEEVPRPADCRTHRVGGLAKPAARRVRNRPPLQFRSDHAERGKVSGALPAGRAR